MAHRKITVRHEVVSPSMAYKTVLEEMYGQQRPLNQSYVRQYALAMCKGEFREGTLVSFAVWEGKRYLINGQHTYHAIILAKMPMRLAIEEIFVESYAEIATWYAQYDRVNNRTLDHAYRAHNLSEEVQLNITQTNHLGGCLPLLASGFEQVARTQSNLRMYIANPVVRMAFVREWASEARRFLEDVKGAPGTMGQNLRRAPIFAVALVTYRYTGADAAEFWQGVAMDDLLAKNDPRKRLHMHIRTSKVGEYVAHVYSRYVAAAWNAAWGNRTPQSIQPQSIGTPIHLEGTPHMGTAILRYITSYGEILHEPEVYESAGWQADFFVQQPGVA